MSKSDSAAFARVVELISEMAWGIDIPSPMKVAIHQTEPLLGREPEDAPGDKLAGKVYAVRPENFEPVFAAIERKLKAAPEYQPYLSLQKENRRLKAQNAALVDALQELVTLVKEGFGDYESGELVQAEAALNAAGRE